MFFVTIGAWLTGIIVSLINGNRTLPIIIFLIGTLTLVAQFTIGLGFMTVAVLAILAVVIWIANKIDMS